MSRPRAAALGLVVAGISTLPLEVRAATVEASTRTLWVARPQIRDGSVESVMPLIESVGLAVSDVNSSWLQEGRLRLAGWGQALPNAAALDENALQGGLDLAFVEGRLLNRRLLLRG